MRCVDAIEALRAGAEADELASAREHVAACAACAGLSADPALAGAATEPRARLDLDAAFTLVDAGLQREASALAWLRNRATPRRRGVALAAGALTVGAVLLATPRADLAVYPALRLGALLALWTGLVWLGVRHALPSDARAYPSPRSVALVVAAALLAAWLPPLLPMAHTAHPASIGGTGAELWARAMPCLLFGMGVSLPTAALAWLATRGPRGFVALSLSLLSSAGLAGLVALHLHCPLVAAEHLALGHASVPLALVVVGTLLRRVATTSPRPRAS